MGSNVLSGYDLKKGKLAKNSAYTGTFWQPLQMIPDKEKGDDWVSQNMDFFEWQGMKMIRRNYGKFIKNYKLAAGEIERSDYIREESPSEFIELVDANSVRNIEALELKYYSFTDTVISILCNEFAERVSLLSFDLRDEISFNELMEAKGEEMNEILIQQATTKQQMKMMQMGISEDSEQGQQMMDQGTIKSLPEVQQYYNKGFRSDYQDWAYDCLQEDVRRFSMQELEVINFKHSLIVDREFWHFRMMENDYNVEIWDPLLVAYQKSPQCKYMSGASWIIHSTEMTVADVVDMYGWMMSAEQLLNMNRIYPLGGSLYTQLGIANDGGFYDPTRSKEWNTEGPGIAMRQHLSALNEQGNLSTGPGGAVNSGNVIRNVLFEGEDLVDYGDISLVRVSTIYWTTQRKVYELSKIDENGELIRDIVGEEYVVTDKPMYNTVLYKEKSKRTLVYGEHLDELWVNEKWGGVKIGPNIPSWAGMTTSTGVQPMYIGYNNGKPGRLPFQFKGDDNLYDSKLPVEGCVFTDLTGNTRSRSLVDRLKPWQIGYNLVNNQIVDLSIDDLGVIMAFNPNILPQQSLGEDWGVGNIEKGYHMMKNMHILPTNRSTMNMDGVIDNSPIERIDLSQAAQYQSLIYRAQYFKNEGLASVGLLPNRVGAPIAQEQTATEIKQTVAASYAQTEHYFTQHSDNLMPRVHQMRTNLAQYYNSTNPSVRIQYTTSSQSRRWLTANGTKLLGRDFGVTCSTKTNDRAILDNIKKYVLSNNTLADNLADQIKTIKAPNMVEMDDIIRKIEVREQEERQQQMQQEQQQHQAELDNQMRLLQEKQQFEASEADKERQKDVYVAEIQANAKAATAKTPDMGIEAYQKGLDRVEAQNNFRESMNLDQQKHLTGTRLKLTDQQIQRQKIQAEENRTRQELQSAKLQAKVKEKESKKKK